MLVNVCQTHCNYIYCYFAQFPSQFLFSKRDAMYDVDTKGFECVLESKLASSQLLNGKIT